MFWKLAVVIVGLVFAMGGTAAVVVAAGDDPPSAGASAFLAILAALGAASVVLGATLL